MEIVRTAGSAFRVDTKRFYVPGFAIHDKCPKCGVLEVKNLSHEYLSYPMANEPMDVNLYCQVCDHGWSVCICLRISLEPGPGTL